MSKNSMNKVWLIGNLGRDPELRFADSESPCLKLSIATSDTWRDKNDQMQERTEWHNVEMWGPRAKPLSEMLAKGMSVFIDGSIRSRAVDGENGTKRYFWDIRARDLMVLDWRNGARPRDAGRASEAGAHASP